MRAYNPEKVLQIGDQRKCNASRMNSKTFNLASKRLHRLKAAEPGMAQPKPAPLLFAAETGPTISFRTTRHQN